MGRVSTRDFGNHLRQLRESRGLSQAEFAAHIAVSVGNVSRWERGLALPHAEMLLVLRDYFKVSLDELFDGPGVLAEPPDRPVGSETVKLLREILAELKSQRRRT